MACIIDQQYGSGKIGEMESIRGSKLLSGGAIVTVTMAGVPAKIIHATDEEIMVFPGKTSIISPDGGPIVITNASGEQIVGGWWTYLGEPATETPINFFSWLYSFFY
jgi:hypothetical protein